MADLPEPVNLAAIVISAGFREVGPEAGHVGFLSQSGAICTVVAFHRTLPEESVVYRYFHMMALQHRTTDERLVRICFTDDERELALVAVGRLSRVHGSNAAELSMLVSDPYQKQGLGTALLGFQLRNAPEVVEAWVDLAGWQPPLEAGGQPA